MYCIIPLFSFPFIHSSILHQQGGRCTRTILNTHFAPTSLTMIPIPPSLRLVLGASLVALCLVAWLLLSLWLTILPDCCPHPHSPLPFALTLSQFPCPSSLHLARSHHSYTHPIPPTHNPQSGPFTFIHPTANANPFLRSFPNSLQTQSLYGPKESHTSPFPSDTYCTHTA